MMNLITDVSGAVNRDRFGKHRRGKTLTQVKSPVVDLPPALHWDLFSCSFVTWMFSNCCPEHFHNACHDDRSSTSDSSSFRSMLHTFGLTSAHLCISSADHYGCMSHLPAFATDYHPYDPVQQSWADSHWQQICFNASCYKFWVLLYLVACLATWHGILTWGSACEIAPA